MYTWMLWKDKQYCMVRLIQVLQGMLPGFQAKNTLWLYNSFLHVLIYIFIRLNKAT